jgi:hypothetical protein
MVNKKRYNYESSENSENIMSEKDKNNETIKEITKEYILKPTGGFPPIHYIEKNKKEVKIRTFGKINDVPSINEIIGDKKEKVPFIIL